MANIPSAMIMSNFFILKSLDQRVAVAHLDVHLYIRDYFNVPESKGLQHIVHADTRVPRLIEGVTTPTIGTGYATVDA